MRYFLVDKITDLAIDRSVRGIKNVSLSEDVYADHFFGYPVMPGALMIESLGQAGTVLLEASCGWKNKAVLIMVERAKFRSFVRPGDQLILEMTVHSQDGTVAQLDGTIHVKEKLVAEMRLTFALKDAEQFYPAKSRHLVQSLYDILLEGASIVHPEKRPEAPR